MVVFRTEKAFRESKEYGSLHQNGHAGSSTADGNRILWCPPPSGYFKINTGAALCPRTKKSGTGFIFRDTAGQCLLTASQLVPFLSSTLGEALAVRASVYVALSYGMDNLIVESDNLEVVKLLWRETHEDNAVLYLIIQDILSVSNRSLHPSSRKPKKLSNAGALALSFFQWAEEQKGFKHTTGIYNGLIDSSHSHESEWVRANHRKGGDGAVFFQSGWTDLLKGLPPNKGHILTFQYEGDVILAVTTPHSMTGYEKVGSCGLRAV
ncbi:hypothetical protein NE237_012555 [Protea cynaroides]|uniref:RNase H type-1 domain-containing protein n=1 Tax=Protea cynaroides TaxID=273540 RepID=A0A9Q0JY43_9MAGN|nr:hypothetical protein NE237_012555 [Protea cynaroides]